MTNYARLILHIGNINILLSVLRKTLGLDFGIVFGQSTKSCLWLFEICNVLLVLRLFQPGKKQS